MIRVMLACVLAPLCLLTIIVIGILQILALELDDD